MTVLPQAKHALTLKRFRQIDNEQYDSHTDPWTAYVKNFISSSPQYNLILRLSRRLSNSSTKSAKSILQFVPFP